MKLIQSLALTLALLAAATAARAEPPADAKVLLDEAVAMFKSKGKDGALKDINGGGKWASPGRYVVVTQFDGLMAAHSALERVRGQNVMEVKDAAGTPFVKETIAKVKAAGASEMTMRFANPATKQIADAGFYARAVPGQDLYVGVVVFK